MSFMRAQVPHFLFIENQDQCPTLDMCSVQESEHTRERAAVGGDLVRYIRQPSQNKAMVTFKGLECQNLESCLIWFNHNMLAKLAVLTFFYNFLL